MINHDTAPYAALLLRSSLGVMFIAHAFLKIFVFTPEGTVGFFSSVGLPGWIAYPTMIAELIGGAMLILGIKTRVVSLVLLPVLIGAVVFVHGANGWQFANQGGGWEFPAFLVMAAITQVLLGDGAYNIRSFLSSDQ